MILNKTIALLLISLISVNNIALANDVVPLDKDQKAPFQGFLFSPQKAQEVKTQLIEADTLKAINESYKRSIELYKSNEKLNEDRLGIVMDQNDKLAKNLNDARSTSSLERFGYFFLGVIGTGLAVYGVKKATQ